MRFEYKNFAFISETSFLAAEAARCAADQGAFWPYHDMIFANQSELFEASTNSRRALRQIAEVLELDTQAFNACFNGREYQQKVRQEIAQGRTLGVDSTPTVFVNGRDLGYPRSFAEIQPIIEEELSKAGQ